MSELEKKIRQLLETVSAENREFRVNRKTLMDNFDKDNYSKEFVELVRDIPCEIDETVPDNEIYLLPVEPKPKPKFYECECGEQIDEPGLCVFCFATANIG